MIVCRVIEQNKKKKYVRTKKNQIPHQFVVFFLSLFGFIILFIYSSNTPCRVWVKCNDRVATAALDFLRPVTSGKCHSFVFFSLSFFFSIFRASFFLLTIYTKQQVKRCKSIWESVCAHTRLLVFRQPTHIYKTIYSQTLESIEETRWTSIWKQPVLYYHELNR